MALQFSYTDEYNIPHPECYAELTHVNFRSDVKTDLDGDVFIKLIIYHSLDAKQQGGFIMNTLTFNITLPFSYITQDNSVYNAILHRLISVEPLFKDAIIV